MPVPGLPLEIQAPLELANLGRRIADAMKNPQRLVVKVHQHHQTVGTRRLLESALHERDVHARGGIQQQLDVFTRARTALQFDLDAVARQEFPVAQRVLVVEAEFGARSQNDAPWRRGYRELDRYPERRAGQHDRQQQRSD